MVLYSTLAYAAIAGPGIILAYAWLKNLRSFERALIGAVLGTGMFIFAAYLVRSVSLGFISFYLIASYISAILLAKKLSLNLHGDSCPAASWAGKDRSILVLLSALLGMIYLINVIPLFFSEFPPGGDPAFHLLLIKKMAINSSLPVDWLPFAPIRVNYPLGSHILAAGMSKISGVEPHQSFKACFPLMAALTAGLIYLLGTALFQERRVGLAAAFSYSFLSDCGGLTYYGWEDCRILWACFFCSPPSGR